ncbi:uncharacterized protein TNCV_2729541 [Trichonephila clavipes]|nr:uncharacterized protein TNCV_2729541 [Trichonephila clavipes]
MCLSTLGSIPIRRFCVQKTCSRPTMSYNTCRRPFSSSFGTKEKNHYCAAARCRPLSSIRKKNLRYYGAKSFHNAGLYARRPVVCVPSTDDSEGTAYAGQENMFLDAATMGFCAVHRRVQIYNGE